MKFSVKISTKGIRDLTKKLKEAPKAAFTQQIAKQTANDVVDEMKDLISKGISPIQGNGKFKKYKQSYKDQILGKTAFYTDEQGRLRNFTPNRKSQKFANKRISPVNLYLTGEFLRNLKFKIVQYGQGFGFNIGFYDRESQLKEEGHAEGANGQEKRPIIPESATQFATSIKKAIQDAYADALAKVLKDL